MDIHVYLHNHTDEKFDRILRELHLILTRQQEIHMADAAALSAALDRLGADLTRIETDLTALKNKPGGINPADLDPILARINAMSDAVEAADPAPVTPPPVTPAP